MLFLASMDDKDAAYMGGVFALVQLSSGCRFETVKNGKIDVFCTLGQENLSFLARYRRNVRSDSLFWHNGHILYALSWKNAVEEYISAISCQKAAF